MIGYIGALFGSREDRNGNSAESANINGYDSFFFREEN